MLAALEKLGEEGPAERLLLSKVLPDRRGAGGGAARASGERRGRGRGLGAAPMAETCKDIDLIATASDPTALAAALTEHPLAAQAGLGGRRRDADRHPQRDLGRPADRRRRTPTATCSSTSPARPSTTSSCASGRSRPGSRSPSTGSPRVEIGQGRALRDRGGGLRAARPRLHRARAARGQRARSPRRRPASCRSWSSSATSAATCTATRRSRTGATRSRRWPRRRASARLHLPRGHRPLGEPRVRRPRHRRRAARSGSRRSREWNAAAKRRFRLLAGSEVNIGTDGSLDYDDELLERARLGGRQRPHLVPDLRARR